jgi:hypothetical protein
MDFKVLTRDNFMLYAMGNYTNPDCTGMSEFTEDLSKIKYIKRLLKKYRRSGKIRPILLLNHMVIMGNVFGAYPAARMLFHKLEEDIHPPLKTSLMYLNYIHEGMIIDGAVIADIPMDMKLAEVLRKL